MKITKKKKKKKIQMNVSKIWDYIGKGIVKLLTIWYI